jgi:hypothetical protein
VPFWKSKKTIPVKAYYGVSRQNLIYVENGAIRLVPRIEREPMFPVPRLKRTYIRMGESWSGSGSPIVTMVQPAEPILRKDALRGCGAHSVVGGSLPQPKMRAVFVIVADIFGDQTFQMAFVHRNNVIQQISSAAFNPTLCYATETLLAAVARPTR